MTAMAPEIADAMRAEVSEKTSKQTYYLRPTGQDKFGATRNWPGNKDHVNLAWDAMSFVIADQRYTVAYLDRPDNPKEARFSERVFGVAAKEFGVFVFGRGPILLSKEKIGLLVEGTE